MRAVHKFHDDDDNTTTEKDSQKRGLRRLRRENNLKAKDLNNSYFFPTAAAARQQSPTNFYDSCKSIDNKKNSFFLYKNELTFTVDTFVCGTKSYLSHIDSFNNKLAPPSSMTTNSDRKEEVKIYQYKKRK